MNPFFGKILTITAAITATFALPITARADAKVSLDKPKIEDIQSPEVASGKAKPFKPKDWLLCEAKLKIDLRDRKSLDKLKVTWYLAVTNPEKEGTYYLLTKEIEYINVPTNEEIFTSVYLSPSSILRLTGSPGSGRAAIKRAGYEVSYNDAILGGDSTNGDKPGWWNTEDKHISRTQLVPLLNKMESPFAMLWWDRYAEIAPKKDKE